MDNSSRSVRARRVMAAAALVGIPLLAQPAAAQQQRGPIVERRECRCVDGDGRDVERCRCMVMPELLEPGDAGALRDLAREALRGWEMPLGAGGIARGAVMGVAVNIDQPDEVDVQGARLGRVESGSGADEAGLREGDVVVAVDGRSLLEPLPDADAEAEIDEDASVPVQRLLALLADRAPGDELEIEYLRDGARATATVELRAPRPFGTPGVRIERFGQGSGPGPRAPMTTIWQGDRDCPSGRDGPPAMLGWGRSCAAGAELIELNEGLASYFQADAGDVLVVAADEENALGLAAGDVILAVGGRDVRGLEHALGVLRSYDDDEQVQLRVLRKGQTLELAGTLR